MQQYLPVFQRNNAPGRAQHCHSVTYTPCLCCTYRSIQHVVSAVFVGRVLRTSRWSPRSPPNILHL